MYSQRPFSLHHRCSLDESSLVLPAWKRALDIVCCVLALPLLALLTTVFMVIAMVCSRGPVIYRQSYSGPFGRTFAAFRFRTRRMSPPAGDEVTQAGHRSDQSPDSPGGAFLRATGLVDLPQIINVMRGEMSIVGPRPQLHLERSVPAVVPGVTGAWRIAASTNAGDEFSTWDRTYARSMSLVADLKVIARSLLAMLGLRQIR